MEDFFYIKIGLAIVFGYVVLWLTFQIISFICKQWGHLIDELEPVFNLDADEYTYVANTAYRFQLVRTIYVLLIGYTIDYLFYVMNDYDYQPAPKPILKIGKTKYKIATFLPLFYLINLIPFAVYIYLVTIYW